MTKEDQDYNLCELFLQSITGNINSIAVGGEGKIDAYQVMPDEEKDQDFFDWYCHVYPNDQFFTNIYECVVRYVIIKRWYDSGGRTKLDYNFLPRG